MAITRLEVENGILGLYDNATAAISSSGTSIVEKVRESSHSGIEASGGSHLFSHPRFGIGIGAARINAGKKSQLVFTDAESWPQVLRIDPEIKVSAFRPGLLLLGGAHKATLDFSGVSFLAGLKLRL